MPLKRSRRPGVAADACCVAERVAASVRVAGRIGRSLRMMPWMPVSPGLTVDQHLVRSFAKARHFRRRNIMVETTIARPRGFVVMNVSDQVMNPPPRVGAPAATYRINTPEKREEKARIDFRLFLF